MTVHALPLTEAGLAVQIRTAAADLSLADLVPMLIAVAQLADAAGAAAAAKGDALAIIAELLNSGRVDLALAHASGLAARKAARHASAVETVARTLSALAAARKAGSQ